jgi:DNA-binding NarL/FixJ family response regulator
MTRYRAVVADDDAHVRAAVAMALGDDPRFEVVAEVDDAHELADVVRLAGADVVLLDVRMPGGGAEAARALHDQGGVVVVAVSAETSPRIVTAMLSAGVQGYLAKDRLGTSLPDLVGRCLAGEVILAVPTGRTVLRRLVPLH